MREPSKGYQRRYAEDADPSLATAWNWWGPTMASTTDWNAKVQENCIAFSEEWQDFVSRRIKEDLGLAQRLANARAPDAVWNAYAKFWQKAADDYAHEYGILAKLTGDIISAGMTAAQCTIEDAVAGAQTPSKAA